MAPTLPALPDQAAGLGLRRALMAPLLAAPAGAFDFLECAPENWIGVGGRHREHLRDLTTRVPLACHGLSLSLGATTPLDRTFLQKLRRFLDEHRVPLYSEHLSYCSDDGQLYDLMPLPFTEACVRHVSARIREVQDVLGRRIAVENVSYYAAPFRAMDEIDFVNAVLAEADCDLLLDVNNIVVNATNHGYDADTFLDALPGERIACLHVAGHYDEAPGLKIDTHGAPVHADVMALLGRACARFGPRPALLERDFNYPPMAELLAEVADVRAVLARHAPRDLRAPQRASA